MTILSNVIGKLMKALNYLNPHFFERPILKVAEELLGCLLCRHTPHGVRPYMIVEVEAYMDFSHAQKWDPASQVPVFSSVSALNCHEDSQSEYLYLIYGMYHCLNVMTRIEHCPTTILIRTVAPVRNWLTQQPVSYDDPNHIKSKVNILKEQISDTHPLAHINKVSRHLNLAYSGDLFILSRLVTPQKIFKTPRVSLTPQKEKRRYLCRLYFDPTDLLSHAE